MHDECPRFPWLPREPIAGTRLGREIEYPLRLAAAKGTHHDVRPDASGCKRVAPAGSALSPHGFQDHEARWNEPGRSDARTDHWLRDPVEHAKELNLDRRLGGFRGHLLAAFSVGHSVNPAVDVFCTFQPNGGYRTPEECFLGI